MDTEKVKELIDLMEANDLCELEIVDGQTRVILKRHSHQGPAQIVTTTPVVQPAVATPNTPTASTSPATPPRDAEGSPEDTEGLAPIKSPIVGTFYAAPSPNADPFVNVGSHVGVEDVVCIVEAMKVMNEIKSEITGTIKKTLVSNGSAVEFGQPLFLVEPD